MSAARDQRPDRLDPMKIELSGTQLIEASAGTGKTHTITTLYLRLLLERELPVGEILVVTYTNAATAELQSRIRRRLAIALQALDADLSAVDPEVAALMRDRARRDLGGRDRLLLTTALYGFDQASIFTIHGFCQRMLRDNAFESGAAFETELVGDPMPALDLIVRDFWARSLYAADEETVRYFCDRRKLSITKLLTLAYTVSMRREIELHGPPPRDDLVRALEHWREIRARTWEVWRREHEELCKKLQQHPGLSQVSYKPAQIATYFAAVNAAFLERAPGVLADMKEFSRLTQEGVESGTNKRATPPRHGLLDACSELLAAEREVCAALDSELYQLQKGLAEYVVAELPKRKASAGEQFFDDLLYDFDAALEGPSGTRLAQRVGERFRAVLIDEFQDTDPVQYRIFRRIYHGRRDAALFLIGDPKQAIYGFRGADVFTYLGAKRDAGSRVATLDTNRRSDPTLLDGVNALFNRVRDPFLFEDIPYVDLRAPEGSVDRLRFAGARRAPLRFLFAPSEENKGPAKDVVYGAVSADIVRLLASGATIGGAPLRPNDIAILCRKNQQAMDMQVELRRVGIPNVLLGDTSVLETVESEELQRLLLAMADPGDTGAIRAALVTPMLGRNALEILALQEDEREWDRVLERFHEWHRRWSDDGFIAAFHRMLADEGVEERLLRLSDGDRRLTNVLHLSELLQTAAMETRRGPLELVEWLQRMREDEKARGDLAREAAQVRLESDAERLKLTTIHKSKGLEYPIVYCPFLTDERLPGERADQIFFHDGGARDRLVLDLAVPHDGDDLAAAVKESLAEGLRLLYVALTRARHSCAIVWGKFDGAKKTALAHLLHGWDKKELTDQTILADLRELSEASGGAIGIEELDRTPLPPYRPAAVESAPLACRSVRRSLRDFWRTSSFSGLVAPGSRVSRLAEEGLDHDEEALAGEETGSAARPSAERVALHDFPAGARPGEFLHRVLETIDFASADAEAIGEAVGRRLAEFGFEPQWRDRVGAALSDVLDTPLRGGGEALRLREIEPAARIDELEFVFPVGRDKPLSAARLASCFACRASEDLKGYADSLARLRFLPVEGYLKGYIDLVFERGGRWYLADYKSNLLGPEPADYLPPALAEAMQRHHYVLQYHLYTVALHLFLRSRLPDYDYDRHFGGVYYLFLRGMAPHHASGCGVFFDRPPRALVGELTEVLAHPGSVGGGT